MTRMAIRVGNGTLSFLKQGSDGMLQRIPYVVKSGMSMAVNLRKAFSKTDILDGSNGRVLLMVDSPSVLVPIDEYSDKENFDADAVFNYTFTGHEHDVKIANVLPDMNAVAIFAVNRDLKLVVDDHFSDVRVQNVMTPVWNHLYRRSMMVTQRRKLYGYFHDEKLDVFSFQQRRFRFSNVYDATSEHSALYYLLFAWNQMGMDNLDDELHLIGDTEHLDWLTTKLRTFLRRVYVLNPVAELNRDPISMMEGLEFDMMV